jgi:nucleoid DNA-binding protein
MNTWVDSVSTCLAREEEVDFGEFGKWFVRDRSYPYSPEYFGKRYVVFQPGKGLRNHLQRR